MTIPNLSGIIEAKDVQEKGTGKFRAKYMAWAKVAELLHEHASGWEFHLRQSESSNSVWSAPDGTGFLVCFFKGPENQQTADFPFPIMDYHNNPIKFSEISARNFTDSHRRALAACSAFTFSLGFELWAREEIEDTKVAEAVAIKQQQPKLEVVKDPVKPAIHKGFGKRLESEELALVIELIRSFNNKYPAKSNHLMKVFSDKWLDGQCVGDKRFWSTHLKFQNQVDFIKNEMEQLEKELEEIPF
tara:strand:- start:1436 stop:2170 length:735 start_codon:yes stop_codon:yes gene_type:complete